MESIPLIFFIPPLEWQTEERVLLVWNGAKTTSHASRIALVGRAPAARVTSDHSGWRIDQTFVG